MNHGVRLRVEGLHLERLTECALKEGARFSSIRRSGPRAMIAETDVHGAAILEKLCRRFFLSFRLLSFRGFGAWRYALRRRLSLCAALIVFAAVLTLFFGRIWKIDVIGAEPSDCALIAQTLRNFGIHAGIAKSAVDAEYLQSELSAASEKFSFIGVRVQGIRLLAEAVPAVPSPPLYDRSRGRDLVAQCDGVIQSVEVRSGAACVRIGDTVARGQMLILGEERISREENKPICALGSVTARTWHEGFSSAPTQVVRKNRTGRFSTASELRLMHFAWPMKRGQNYPLQETEVRRLPIVGLFFPLEIRKTTIFEVQSRPFEPDENLLRRRLETLAYADAAVQLCRSHPTGAEIARRWIEYTRSDGRLTARAVYETHTDIAVYRDDPNQQGG